ncbi:hypothetical protein [Micromonospora robiginosa]|uniref:Uncharacterized protein n=1 Tax=Micromonospora robiginosa TaxID=2749844 RepID=A0A7L6BDQ7_9ACTN|nr:hypothetical protein [Micromonospora ferruginea]QLQ40047.1 hypothetical protein H1D33_15190 [Micromonospora ferruginea]
MGERHDGEMIMKLAASPEIDIAVNLMINRSTLDVRRACVEDFVDHGLVVPERR